MILLSEETKNQLVTFVLNNTPVWYFNMATKRYSVQMLYSRCKDQLMSKFPEIMGGSTLTYAIVMCEAFRKYQVNEIELPDLSYRMGVLKGMIHYYKKCRPIEYSGKVDEYNALVNEYNTLLAPQNALISLYKKIVRESKKKP